MKIFYSISILTVLILTSAFSPLPNNLTIKPTPADKLGKEVYKSLCKSCHGEDGKLMKQNASDLSITSLTKPQIKMIVIHGKGKMAAYKTKLDQEEINAVSDYIINTIVNKEGSK